jgi:hypothetical protein
LRQVINSTPHATANAMIKIPIQKGPVTPLWNSSIPIFVINGPKIINKMIGIIAHLDLLAWISSHLSSFIASAVSSADELVKFLSVALSPDYFFDLFIKNRQFVLDDVPDNAVVNAKILMNDDVPEGCHGLPFNIMMFVFEFLRQLS